MKKILFFALLICSSYSVVAQNTPLVYHSQSKKVYRNDSLCNMDVLFQMMRPHEEAFKLIVSARDYRFFSTIFGAVGGGVMGFPIGAFIVTGNFNWTVFSIGAGLTGISLVLHLKHLQQTKRAVIAYNGTLNHSFRPRSELGIRFSLNGIGLMLSL